MAELTKNARLPLHCHIKLTKKHGKLPLKLVELAELTIKIAQLAVTDKGKIGKMAPFTPEIPDIEETNWHKTYFLWHCHNTCTCFVAFE